MTRRLSALRPYARPLTLLYFIVVLRTLTTASFSTFVPVMLHASWSDAGAGGNRRFGVSLCHRARRFLRRSGRRSLRPAARDHVVPRVCGAVSRRRAAAVGWQFVATLAMGGFLLQSTLPVNVTFGQTIAPISAATVSSLMMGFAWGVGGLTVPFVGMLADNIGIPHTLMVMSAVPLVAAALALPLPSAHRVPSVPVTP
jgi:FSR family fosmidomycin resistance protein-like MFS transporter